ncbi:hypothetical protein Golob_025036 [Gossypium lobatum]|uniref:DUF4283 domain-containing protein n=1 Tax=Gossypium lobatum TaxID=34289 RepID=A0A7J8NKT9_9ROSI|nr:hypothetical protein [Gossypium lobatum]
MEDDLANLALADEEEEAFQEDAVVFDQNLQLILVERCLTDSIVHFPSLRNTMADLWHPIKAICISDLGERRFLFQFFHEVDIRRVLIGTPWFFNNHLLLLHRIQSGENPSLVPLTFSEFWVQAHDLPPGLMSESMAKQFEEFLGQFLEYDTSIRSINSHSFMRIRVQLNVTVPLKRKKKVMVGSNRIFYARFQIDPKKIVFGWGISIRAVARRRSVTTSRWLREADGVDSKWIEMEGEFQGGFSRNLKDSGNFRRND